jgi:radical SAM protein with 4Fe4S-binding SPASM domain
LDIETTNVCNLACVMCPRTRMIRAENWAWSPNGLGYMPFPVFQTLVDEAADQGAYSVKLNWLGEPLLHPDVVRQVAYARQKGLYVMMNTNAVRLTPETSRRLLDAGLTDIFFSLDSLDPEAYGRIRAGGRLDQVLGNIEALVRIRNERGLTHVQTRAAMVTDVLEPTPPDQIEGFTRRMAELGVDEVGYGPPEDGRDHTVDNETVTGFVCEQPYQRLFVTWDGMIAPCCGHMEREYPLGEFPATALKKAWTGPALTRLRQAHEAGRFQDVAICRRCAVPYLTQKEPSPEAAR